MVSVACTWSCNIDVHSVKTETFVVITEYSTRNTGLSVWPFCLSCVCQHFSAWESAHLFSLSYVRLNTPTTNTCICVYMQTQMDIHMYIWWVHVCKHLYIWKSMFWGCMRVYLCVCSCVYVWDCLHVCTRVCLSVRSDHHEVSHTSLSTRMERAKAGFISCSIMWLCFHFLWWSRSCRLECITNISAENSYPLNGLLKQK